MAKSNTLLFRLSDASAKLHLQRIASDSSRVAFTLHAKAQMRHRRITPMQVVRCLARGIITESPVMDPHGNWKLRIERYVSGENIGCAVALDVSDPRAIIITAFWVK